ncbi:MAG: hypothetical protein J7L66_01650 [Anaerolineaceae bacterium]|nr:hypothetical protein [Anaerolineaceae bacterium]
MTHLLVVGGPSIDILHISGETVTSPGGAGMYVAMAAKRSGMDVSMFGPHADPLPDLLRPIANRLEAWIGPKVLPSELPHFEISHVGDKAEYLKFFLGSELGMSPDGLPEDLSVYDGVHLTALGDSELQKTFLQAIHERGANFISIGTFIRNIIEKPDVAKYLIEKADVSFMNEEEAVALFGSLENAGVRTNGLLFITLAEKGALVVQGDYRTYLPAVSIKMRDPTGAGETFCGAAIANLLQGAHPIMAGRRAIAVAGEKIEGIGPSALLRDDAPPDVPLDERIQINAGQVEKIAQVVKRLPEADPFNFVGDYLPPVGHPAALDYFFSVTLQQFSFWEVAGGKYSRPMIAEIDGKKLKGSRYLYYAWMRLLDTDPGFYTPERQANLTKKELLEILRADDNSDPMPALDLHLRLANQYGRDMQALGMNTREFIRRAQESTTPLKTFLIMLDHISGYKEDPIRKKANLLALSLSQRPEAFLTYGRSETAEPVVDYHCMRSCLRTGLIDVLNAGLKAKIKNRELLSADSEWAIRYAAYKIQKQIERLSGKPIGAVDWFFFNYTRSHCPEMTEPVCRDCAVDPVCAHRKELFQPVIRTTYY